MMNPEIKQKWIEALRSGKYKENYDEYYKTINYEYSPIGILLEINDQMTDRLNQKNNAYCAKYNETTENPIISSEVFFHFRKIYEKEWSFNFVSILLKLDPYL